METKNETESSEQTMLDCLDKAASVSLINWDNAKRIKSAPHGGLSWWHFEKIIFAAMQDYAERFETKKGEKTIICPYCNGDGYTPEHNDHSPYEPCNQCPIQVPCGYCFASGKVTTEIMKQHINESKTDVLNLPF